MPYDIIIGRDKSDKAKFKDKGLIYLGKGYVKMGNYTSLSNIIWMDVARSHVIMIAGKRGSGKSYTLSTIAEELCDLPQEISQNLAPLIFDTMGIFWTMKFKNEKEIALLNEWSLEPKNLPVKIWAPYGYSKEYEKRQIPIDNKFALSCSELEAEDWILTFNLKMIDPVSIIIQQVLSDLKEEKNDYNLKEIIERISSLKENTEAKNACLALFNAVKTWGIFAEKKEESTKISELITPGVSTVLDISCYSSLGEFNIRALVIGLVCKKIFNERMLARKKEEMLSLERGTDYLSSNPKRDFPLVWIFIDEVHEFLPKQGKTAATNSLIQLLREGRQPGISLVLATQQPGVIHTDAMTQSDIVIAHRLTAKPDIEALNSIMQTYLLESITKKMEELPALNGSALILDDNSERIYPVRIRPKFTWHGGESPSSIKVEKE
jgi:hypothetical protein